MYQRCREAISLYRSIYSRMDLLSKTNNVSQIYRLVFANRLRFHRSLDVSKPRLPCILLFCCFVFFGFFFSFSIYLFLFLVFLVSQKSEGNMMQLKLAWLAMQTRSQGISGLYIYTLALFFIWWYLKSERTKGERISSALYAEFSM